jgi:hypothetical protein
MITSHLISHITGRQALRRSKKCPIFVPVRKSAKSAFLLTEK